MVTHAIGSENKPCIHNLLLAVVVVAEYVYILMVKYKYSLKYSSLTVRSYWEKRKINKNKILKYV